MYIWRFIKKPDELNDDNVPAMIKYNIYAITSSKKLAKRFQEERNMSQFIIRKSKVSKEEYAEYAMAHRGKVLTLQSLLTADNKNKKNQHKERIEVLLTQDEYVNCTNPSLEIEDEGWWINYADFLSPYRFNDKIVDSLRYLDYNMLYKLMVSPPCIADEDDDYEAPDWLHDELQFFITVYGNTFK